MSGRVNGGAGEQGALQMWDVGRIPAAGRRRISPGNLLACLRSHSASPGNWGCGPAAALHPGVGAGELMGAGRLGTC